MKKFYEWKSNICGKKTKISVPVSFHDRFKEIEPLHFEAIFKSTDNESTVDDLISRDIDSHRNLLELCPHFLGSRMILVRNFEKMKILKYTSMDVDYQNQYPGVFVRKRDLIDINDFMDEAIFMVKLHELNCFLRQNFDNDREIKLLQATISTIDGDIIVKAYPDEEVVMVPNKYSHRVNHIMMVLNDLISIMEFQTIESRNRRRLLPKYDYTIKNIDILKYIIGVSICCYKCKKRENGGVGLQPLETFTIHRKPFTFSNEVDLFTNIATFMSIYSELYNTAFSITIWLIGTEVRDLDFNINTISSENVYPLDVCIKPYKLPVYSDERKFIKMIIDKIPEISPYDILSSIKVDSDIELLGKYTFTIPPSNLMPLLSEE